MKQKEPGEVYGDIIDLPRPHSHRKKPMPLMDRAAQFAPFAALSGYDEMVWEEARLTETKTDLSEYELEQLNRTLSSLRQRLAAGEAPLVTVSFFRPDARKAGGSYESITGRVKDVDSVEKRLLLYGSENIEDRRVSALEIPFEQIMLLALTEEI